MYYFFYIDIKKTGREFFLPVFLNILTLTKNWEEYPV